ncbi:sensor histidine kinase [Pleomorphovibrio marinus]|uniref:sensor histidine kinase n=1 Tax=Pleomorphovibrio marinus TaxID=2164132 RepID=UPI000E09F34E|nr:ATP-binding protein [Pleomorphovibrio marinus]
MSIDRRYLMFFQTATLVFFAAMIAGVVFLVDMNTDKTVAVASMYAIVILYSWLIPGKYASIFTAFICTFLTITAVILSDDMLTNASDLSNMNMVISLVVIWTCVTLVFIAKSSFSNLEGINKKLSESSAALFENVKELDDQQQELSEHKILLENLNTDLLVKNRELERFTSIASHDLQEPLRTIGNMTQLISNRYYSKFDEQGKKMLEYVTSATGRMTLLIKGFLDFSRIGNKREFQKVDSQELVHTIVMDFDAALKAVNGRVMFKELPIVIGNPVELRMLFQNLIGNGLKFRKQDVTPIIEVSANENNTHVEFCVKDNGIGIEKSDYDKIFLIFQRLHATEEYDGTGLGLAYCRKIVEIHGGKIWIDSKKELGSSFYFTLAKVL